MSRPYREDRQNGAGRAWQGWIWLALVILVMAGLTGCQKSAVVTGNETIKPHPGVIPVTIDDQHHVNPARVTLSMTSRHMVQWQNTSRDTVLLLFVGAPTGELIPPADWSAPFHVCVSCQVGPYEYRLHTRVGRDWVMVPQDSTGPDVPEVVVGD
jgi:hypothetical protein